MNPGGQLTQRSGNCLKKENYRLILDCRGCCFSQMRFILRGGQFSGIPVLFGLELMTFLNCSSKLEGLVFAMSIPSSVGINVTTSVMEFLNSAGIMILPLESILTWRACKVRPTSYGWDSIKVFPNSPKPIL